MLDEICAHKRQEVKARQDAVPLAALEERIDLVRPTRDFRAALRKPGISLIAEIKRASPSVGQLMHALDAVNVAGLYEGAGARAISVLTDAHYFGGSLEDLTEVHRHVALPCLRKDFVIDEYQIYEARAAEADAVLLIVRILSDQQLKDYLALTASLDMAALVETHTAEEIGRALHAKAHIIGINNRNLDTFKVDINTTLLLKKLVPGGHVLVSESGISTREQVQLLEDGGIDAVLVGEALLRSEDVGQKIWELTGRDES